MNGLEDMGWGGIFVTTTREKSDIIKWKLMHSIQNTLDSV